MTTLTDLHGPADLRGMDERQLAELAAEIRETIIRTVAVTGGHLGSSLGVVELTIALHRLLESPRDRIVWDTGHQAYPHKLLTGRLDRFGTLRQLDGVGGFPRRTESAHDVFDGGHAGTGLSIAQGLAEARDLRHGLERIAVVVGDAALMSGLSLEALNDIGQRQTQMLIVVNDNEMSISPTVGAFSKYLSQIKLSGAWRQSKSAYDRTVETRAGRRPHRSSSGPSGCGPRSSGSRSRASCSRTSGSPTSASCPATTSARSTRRSARRSPCPGPTIVHVRTQKGRGFRPAEADQVGFHGAALPPMTLAAASRRVRRAQSDDADRIDGRRRRLADDRAVAPAKHPNYTAVFAAELIELGPAGPAHRRDHGGHADRHRHVQARRRRSPTGSSTSGSPSSTPSRFATGLALGGMRPVVALYSTFLQRAFDQTVHDVCQNDAPVLLAVDRAGLVGEDGTSHQGMFMIPAQRQLPNLVIAAPRDEQELRSLLRTALAQDHPFALHYPRDAGFGLPTRSSRRSCRSAVAETLREGRDLLFVGFGPIVASRPGCRRRPRGGGLEHRGHQRPVRQAARPAAHPRRGPRQAAGRDVRGERRDRRVRQCRARDARGGALGRSGATWGDRPHRSASRVTGSWTTARSSTSAASCGSMPTA